jgi:hypothetical protein
MSNIQALIGFTWFFIIYKLAAILGPFDTELIHIDDNNPMISLMMIRGNSQKSLFLSKIDIQELDLQITKITAVREGLTKVPRPPLEFPQPAVILLPSRGGVYVTGHGSSL